MAAKNNIGILTGGGDVPGLNPVIKSVVYRAKEMGRQVIGIRKGWEGLTHMASDSNEDPIYIRPLTRDNTRTIDRTGGTVLHTSRTNPRKILESKIPKHISPDRIKKLPFDGKHYDFTPIVLENLDRLGIGCLVTIGGDDNAVFITGSNDAVTLTGAGDTATISGTSDMVATTNAGTITVDATQKGSETTVDVGIPKLHLELPSAVGRGVLSYLSGGRFCFLN